MANKFTRYIIITKNYHVINRHIKRLHTKYECSITLTFICRCINRCPGMNGPNYFEIIKVRISKFDRWFLERNRWLII